MSVSPVSICCRASLHSSKKVLLQFVQTCHELSALDLVLDAYGATLRTVAISSIRIEWLDHPSGGTGLAREVLLFGIAFGRQHQDRRRLVARIACAAGG